MTENAEDDEDKEYVFVLDLFSVCIFKTSFFYSIVFVLFTDPYFFHIKGWALIS